MRVSVVVKMVVGGRSSSSAAAAAAALLALMMVTSGLVTKTDCFSFNDQQTTINVSLSTWCDGLNVDDVSCLIGQSTDLDSEEFMLDSEFSRRILGATAGGNKKSYSQKTLDPAKAVSCDRKGFPPCHPSGKNKGPPKAHCDQAPTNKYCYKYP